MKRKVIAVLFASLMAIATAAPAFAAPSFGPGSSGGGPNDANAKCHPPGQTTETPGCK
jgi:TolA-binding protein